MADGQFDEATIRAALNTFLDPETGQSVMQTGQVRDIAVDSGKLSLTLALTTHSAPLWDATKQQLENHLRVKLNGLSALIVNLAVHQRSPEKLGQIGLTTKSVIAVGSGKGGVGKSTIASCVAFGLKRAGCHVGLLDADMYGPSIPHLLGVDERPSAVGQRLQPIDAHGLKVMSMGFLVPPGEAIVWRGPMLHGAIQQFLRDTDWGELDYLIIDMPPGTGDVALTLSQLVPLTGAVVVCTPQDVALLDAVKAVAMFRKVNIDILGMVENMSYFECPDCNKRYDIFGSGGAKSRAEQMEIPFLGEVPINMQIRIRGDEGTTEGNFDDVASAPYLETICGQLVENIAAAKKKSAPLPSL